MIQFAGSPLIKGIADRASDRAFRIWTGLPTAGPAYKKSSIFSRGEGGIFLGIRGGDSAVRLSKSWPYFRPMPIRQMWGSIPRGFSPSKILTWPDQWSMFIHIRRVGCFCYMYHTLFWRSKIRITTRTGTLRSSYHSPLARAQTSGKASPGTSNTNLLY